MRNTDTIIIGAGLTGLTVAHKLRTHCYGHRFILLEKSDSTGGVIRTHQERGFTAEIGPHGFLDNCKESRDILEETGLVHETVKSPLLNFVRYILMDGQLRVIPQTPLKIASAPLIPWKSKLRVLGELFKKPLGGQPTVAKWVEHRFGEALLPFADAVFTGTYAGDMDRLTIDSVMPGVRKLEKEYGSVIKGAAARAFARKKSGAGGQKFRMPAMTSFPQGMQRLPQRLTEYFTVGEDLLLNCGVTSIRKEDGMWYVHTDNGTFCSANIVLAVPTNVSIQLLADFTPPPIPDIPEAWITTVVFGFGPGSSLPPGFGYLTPEKEHRFSLGTLFSSNMFPGRAPADHILFETLIGGRRHPERLTLSDQELISHAYEDIKDVLSVKGEPVYTKVLRPWGAIPQLEGDYPSLLLWRDQLMLEHPGLYISGFGWEGIGLNDMMKHGVHTAHSICRGSRRTHRSAEVKGVYF